MSGISVSSLSTQYILVPVRAFKAGVLFNPTADTVQLAFMVSGTPGTSDWKTGSWASTTAVNGVYLAQILIGPKNSGVVLALGSYTIWVQITDNPEIPVMAVGSLAITP